ncbi:MAG: 3-deoxy-D-manno-octulosonic acid transferase [Syntrophales bacterium]|jgi:3-deoxy-D-manno-octulosonic-acid transferase|nr:3-deoxy-D-manno-octulosonic acid transferase [Syntrophales bacterium]MDY0043518.1 3-deoxy-D-manno-octulosonic acid transferase [Syntrophales bacterium]
MRYFLYNLVLGAAAIILVPYYGFRLAFTGKYKRSAGAKLGFYSPETFRNLNGTPRIWVHAVSVGEVSAAKPIIEELRARYPEGCIILSTSTETGHDTAKRLVGGAAAHLYYPLDIPWVIDRIMGKVVPDVFVPVETEIWPNFIHICRKLKVKVVMVNGRISPRSFAGYKATRFFWAKVLESVDSIGVISTTDAERFEAIGAQSHKISIIGNAKYDSLDTGADEIRLQELMRLLALSDEVPVLVAGSTHEGEEKILFDVFKILKKEFPDLVLFIVPRHIERVGAIRHLLIEEGLDREAICFTELVKGKNRDGRQVVIVDAMGILFALYGCADAVYCGGSLVPRGGQNALEAAAWGKVVFFGPHMEDFISERDQLVAAGAGITVTCAKDLAVGINAMFSKPEERRLRGEAGKGVLQKNRGASLRYADLISSVLLSCQPCL